MYKFILFFETLSISINLRNNCFSVNMSYIILSIKLQQDIVIIYLVPMFKLHSKILFWLFSDLVRLFILMILDFRAIENLNIRFLIKPINHGYADTCCYSNQTCTSALQRCQLVIYFHIGPISLLNTKPSHVE